MLNGVLLLLLFWNWVNKGFAFTCKLCLIILIGIWQLLCSIDSTNWKTWCGSAWFCHFSSPMVGCRAYIPASILPSQLYEWIYGPHSWWIWGSYQNLILTTYIMIFWMLHVVDKVIFLTFWNYILGENGEIFFLHGWGEKVVDAYNKMQNFLLDAVVIKINN